MQSNKSQGTLESKKLLKVSSMNERMMQNNFKKNHYTEEHLSLITKSSFDKTLTSSRNKLPLNSKTDKEKKFSKVIPKVPQKSLNMVPSEDIFKKIKSDLQNSKKDKEEIFQNNTQYALKQYMESQLQINKYHSENKILKEKVTSLKKICQMKNKEIEIIEKKYRDVIDKLSMENDALKNFKNDNNSIFEKNKKLQLTLKSTLSVMIEVLEMIINNKSNNNNKSCGISNSISIDIYESYHQNEDEKRLYFLDEIKKIIENKLIYIQNQFEINVESEFEKLKKAFKITSSQEEYSTKLFNTKLKLEINSNNQSHNQESEKKASQMEIDINTPQKIYSPNFLDKDDIQNMSSKYNKSLEGDLSLKNNNLIFNDSSMMKEFGNQEILKEDASSKKKFEFESTSSKGKRNPSVLDFNDNPSEFNVEFNFSAGKPQSNYNFEIKPVIYPPDFELVNNEYLRPEKESPESNLLQNIIINNSNINISFMDN